MEQRSADHKGYCEGASDKATWAGMRRRVLVHLKSAAAGVSQVIVVAELHGRVGPRCILAHSDRFEKVRRAHKLLPDMITVY